MELGAAQCENRDAPSAASPSARRRAEEFDLDNTQTHPPHSRPRAKQGTLTADAAGAPQNAVKVLCSSMFGATWNFISRAGRTSYFRRARANQRWSIHFHNCLEERVWRAKTAPPVEGLATGG